jgi:hypothetical protein
MEHFFRDQWLKICSGRFFKETNELKLLVIHNKLHKSTKVKLVWPFTSNVRRENG